MELTVELGARMAGLAQELAGVAAAPDAADRPALDRGLRIVARLRSYCDAAEGAITPAFERLVRIPLPAVDEVDERAGPAAPPLDTAGDVPASVRSPADADLAEVPRESADELARRLARAKWLRRCERFAEALMAGTVKGDHIDALAKVLGHVEPTVVADVLAEEDRLLEVARTVGHVAFGRYVRDVVDRIRADGGVKRLDRQIKDSFASWKLDELTGMYTLYARLDPIRGGEVAALLQQQIDALYSASGATTNLSYGAVVATALHSLLTAPTSGRASKGPSLLIVADARSLRDGPHADTVCETNDGAPIPVDHVRSLIDQALVTIAITDDEGIPLKLGRTARLATLGQRMALRAMYRHCAFPGCRALVTHTQAHHVVFWDGDDGPTDLDNLVPLCRRHHRLIHDEGWRLTLGPDRTIRTYRPDGTLHATARFTPPIRPPTAAPPSAFRARPRRSPAVPNDDPPSRPLAGV